MTAASDEVTAANAKTIAAVAHLIWTSGDIAGKRARVTFIEKPFFVHSSEDDFHEDDYGLVRAVTRLFGEQAPTLSECLG